MLFGGSGASEDKCFLALPFLLPKARALSLPTPTGSPQSPFGPSWQGSRSLGEEVSPVAWEQGSRRVTPQHHALCSGTGSQPCLCWITQRTTARRVWQLEVTFHPGDAFIQANPFFPARFCSVNSDCDKKNGSQATFWGTDEHILKEHRKKRNSCRHLAINTNTESHNMSWCSL